MARLKVFKAQMGFFESVVAAASQKAALDAWGTRQNLFGEGMAAVTDDAEAVKAALAKPGTVLRRPVGGGAFEEADKAVLPKAPVIPRAQRPAPKAKRAPPAEKPRPEPADRSALTAAEKALEIHRTALERDRERARRRVEEAEADLKKLEAEAGEETRTLKQRVEKARSAYRKAGGET